MGFIFLIQISQWTVITSLHPIKHVGLATHKAEIYSTYEYEPNF
jgi:hypothetical protein